MAPSQPGLHLETTMVHASRMRELAMEAARYLGRAAPYWLGLAGACLFGWLGFSALGYRNENTYLYWLWFGPVWYLACWLILTSERFWKGIRLAAFMVFLSLPLLLPAFILGALIGPVTVFLLMASLGAILYGMQQMDGQALSDRWLLLHVLGTAPAGFAMIGSLNASKAAFQVPIAGLAVGLLFHAALAWRQWQIEGRRPPSLARAATIVVLAYGLAGGLYVRQWPERAFLTWPFDFSTDASYIALANVRPFEAGELIRLDIAGDAAWLTVPPGWMGEVRGWPATTVFLQPRIPARSPSLVVVTPAYRVTDWFSALPRSGGDAAHRTARCAAPDPALGGLYLCYPSSPPFPRRPDFFPDPASLPIEVVAGDSLRSGGGNRVFVAGGALRGYCDAPATCRLGLPLAGGREVEMTMAFADLARWPQLRADLQAKLGNDPRLRLIEYDPILPARP